MLPTLSFCAEPNGEVAESFIQKITLVLPERGTVADGGRGPGKSPFLYPSSALAGSFSQGEDYFSLRETLDSATPGKPFVQNDMRES